MRLHFALFLVAVQALDFGAFQGDADQWFPAESSPPEVMGGSAYNDQFIVPQAIVQGRRVELPPYGPPLLLDPITETRNVYGPYPARRIDGWIPTEFVPEVGYAYRLHDGLEYVITDRTTRPVIRRKRTKLVTSYTSYLHQSTALAVQTRCRTPLYRSSDPLCISLDAWRSLRAAAFYRQYPFIIDIRTSPSVWGVQQRVVEPSTILAADGLRYGVALASPAVIQPRFVLPPAVSTYLIREIETRIKEVQIRTARLPYNAYAVDLDDATAITTAPLQYLRAVLKDSVTDTNRLHITREIPFVEAERVKNVLMAVVDGVSQLPDLIQQVAQSVDESEQSTQKLADFTINEDEDMTSLAFIQIADGSLITITPNEAQQVLANIETADETTRLQSVEDAPSNPGFAGEGLLDMPFQLLSSLLGRGQNGAAGTGLMSIVPGVGNLINNLGGGQQARVNTLGGNNGGVLGFLGGIIDGGVF